MPTGRSNFQSTFYTLLTLHICKVKVERILTLVEFTTGVDNCRLVSIVAIEETDNICQILHTINVKLVDDCSFSSILLRNNKTLELLFPSTNSYRQCTCHRLQFTIKTQFSYHHELG